MIRKWPRADIGKRRKVEKEGQRNENVKDNINDDNIIKGKKLQVLHELHFRTSL